MKKIVIIGGGISGLSTAYFLKEEAREKGEDIKLTLIEKNKRLGGNIVTEKYDGFIIEGGPDCFLSSKPWAYELCKKIGLKDELLNTNEGGQTFVLSNSKLKPLPEGFVLMIPTKIMPFIFNTLISVPGKLRMLLDFVKPKGDQDADESLGSFVTRRLGKEATEKIAEPLVAGVHAGDPETMSIKSSFPKFVDMEQRYGSLIKGMFAVRKMAKGAPKKEGQQPTMFVTLKSGLKKLVDELQRRVNENSIQYGESITKIEKENNKYKINIEGEKAMEADIVILSTPAYVSAQFIEGMDKDLAENIKEIPYVSTATISMAFDKKDIKGELKGFGFVIPSKENRKIMATTYSSLKFAGRAPQGKILIRCFVGGASNQELVEKSEEELVELAYKELRDIIGIEAKPLFAKVFKWKNAMPQYVIGHSKRIEEMDEMLKKHPGLYLTGTAYRGIGIADSIKNAEILAKQILTSVEKQ